MEILLARARQAFVCSAFDYLATFTARLTATVLMTSTAYTYLIVTGFTKS